MSSIASITTFGFGSSGNINLAVTLGYIGTTTPAAVTGGHYVDIRIHLQKIKAQQAALEAREAEKLKQARDLRQQIEEAINPSKIAEKPQKQAISTEFIPLKPNNLIALYSELQRLENELDVLYKQAKIQARMLQDEDDIEVLLYLLQ